VRFAHCAGVCKPSAHLSDERGIALPQIIAVLPSVNFPPHQVHAWITFSEGFAI
jgi:hypothetical protein